MFSPPPPPKAEWQIYAVEDEFLRLQLCKEDWRITQANEVALNQGKEERKLGQLTFLCFSHMQSYGLCPTYPRRFIVPASVSDADLSHSAGMHHHG